MASLTPKEISKKAAALFEPGGFECYPFLIKWYNEIVAKEFHLPYDANKLCFIVISSPSMFEKAFTNFIMKDTWDGVKDPIDDCIADYFEQVKSQFKDYEIDCVYDYERYHNRRPKVLVQTAGHVAGAAFFYQRQHVLEDPWDKTKKVCGVSMHPQYGGWFGLRGVMIFKNVEVPELERKEPPDVVIGDEKRIDLLDKFNYHWQDWTFRDVIPVKERYSEDQISYFGTLPKNRKDLIEKLRSGISLSIDNNECKDTGHSFVNK